MKSLLIVAFFLSSAMARTGNEGGAGGDGVLLGTDLYLIDLVEAGIETNPFIDKNFENDPIFPDVVKRLEVPLAPLKDADATRLLALKLIEISKISTPLALTLLHTIESYRWVLVNHALVNVADEDSVLEIGAGTLTQLAIRRLHSISVSRDSWQKLDAPHRSALIVHEAAFAIVDPDCREKEPKDQVCFQSSPKARELVGVLYTGGNAQLDELLHGFGPLGYYHYGKAPENYYESIRNRTFSWRQAYTLHLTVQRLHDKALLGKNYDPLAGATAKDICAEAFELMDKLHPYPRNKPPLFNTEFFLWESNSEDYYEVWGSYYNKGADKTVYKKWVQSPPVTWPFHSLNKAQWDPAACEESVEFRLKAFRLKFEHPNVFWKKTAATTAPPA